MISLVKGNMASFFFSLGMLPRDDQAMAGIVALKFCNLKIAFCTSLLGPSLRFPLMVKKQRAYYRRSLYR